MKWGRELALLLVVAAAGTAWWFSLQHDQQKVEAADEALFPGFDGARVRTIVAEDLRWDWHMRLQRDERGGWKMTDPIAVPARLGLVEHLLEVALRAHGPEVPASELDPVQLGFMPPRVVLEIEELVDGKSRHERVEIGGLDADNRRVNVRVRNRYLRVGRELDTAIDRQLDEFKTDLALEFNITDVVHVRRTGQLRREGASEPADVGLDLELTDEGWRSIAPGAEGLALDPTLVLTWLQGLAAIHHAGYFDELGARLDAMGLDPPELRLELEMRDGTKHALRVGRPGHVEGQVWYVLRESLGIVWGLEQFPVWLIGFPLEDMLDPRILRARREEVTTITLHRRDDDLLFTPEGKLWHLARRRAGEKSFDKPVLADPPKVDALLAALEKTELDEFRIGTSVPETPELPAVWVAVGGITSGGWFGEESPSRSGAPCVRFQRRGENASSLAPKSLLDSVQAPIEDFWSMKLADIEEHAQLGLSIQGLGKDLRYDHNPAGKWSRAEDKTRAEAKELYTVLDSLCFLRAQRYLPQRVASDAPWDDRVTVEFTDAMKKKQKIEIGRSREGAKGEEVELVFEDHRAVAKDQGLHARLLEILRAP